MSAPPSRRAGAFLQHGVLHAPQSHSLAPCTALSRRRLGPPAQPPEQRRAWRTAPRLAAAPGHKGRDSATTREAVLPSTRPSVTDRPHEFWTEQWYPVAFTHDVPPGKLHSFRVFDRPYVLFMDEATGLYVVMDDVCPHRAVPLSEGRLLSVDNRTVLECAYHGWQFDCSGACTLIPGGGPEFRIPTAANIGGLYATAVTKAELVFFFPGDRLRADAVPIVQPEMLVSDAGVKVYREYWRQIPLPFELLVENLADPAHVAFAHHGTGEGDRDVFMHRNPAKGQRVTARDDAFGELETTGARGKRMSVVATQRGGGTSNTVVVTTAATEMHLFMHVVPTTRGLCNLFSYRVVRVNPTMLSLKR